MNRCFLGLICIFFVAACAAQASRSDLDPLGRTHIPIGLPDTVDTLKTFVEAEGALSPGFATYGIYFWVFDPETKKLTAPTMEGVSVTHGLQAGGLLIPWVQWKTADFEVRTDITEFRKGTTDAEGFTTAATVRLKNLARKKRTLSLFAVLRPVGPAGGSVATLSTGLEQRALLVDDKIALLAGRKADQAGVLNADEIGEAIRKGIIATEQQASSPSGDCSGALRFDLKLGGNDEETISFLCPVLPGRRAVGHKWDGKSEWAQLDEARPNPPDGGSLQPDPGVEYYRQLDVNREVTRLFQSASAYWQEFTGRIQVKLPDPKWGEALAAIGGHLALCLNEGAPDVAVINYNVFNRDGVYTANVFQKSGHADLASRIIDYFFQHPFNGRIYPEADNPGQILWLTGQQWMFSRDEQWAKRVYPSVKRLAEMVEYCRTTPEPHWVSMTSLDFGGGVPQAERQELKPGRCDGQHPEYTEAFDVAGLRYASVLARAAGESQDAFRWMTLAEKLIGVYNRRFGTKLARDYGSYCVLWPCALYPSRFGAASDQFKSVTPQQPDGWRYFPLATSHQGLLTGTRECGYKTIQSHLDHEQMKGWYAFDEGGKSGPGGWQFARTTWSSNVAMPHGWAIAEMWLLIRDSLVHEDGNKLVLFDGIPPEWFLDPNGLMLGGLPTHFGVVSLTYTYKEGKAVLKMEGAAAPPGGFGLRIPESIGFELEGKSKKRVQVLPNKELSIPAGVKEVELLLTPRKAQ